MNPRDPINHLYLSQLSLANLCAEHYDKAVRFAEEAIRRKSGFIESHLALASALGHLGEPKAAERAIGQFKEIAADFIKEHLVFSEEVKERVLKGLWKAGLPK